MKLKDKRWLYAFVNSAALFGLALASASTREGLQWPEIFSFLVLLLVPFFLLRRKTALLSTGIIIFAGLVVATYDSVYYLYLISSLIFANLVLKQIYIDRKEL